MEDIPNLTAIEDGDPEKGFQLILQDLEKRLLRQGVKSHSLLGIRIAMQISFRLGERNMAHEMMKSWYESE
jgi:hypothetical protein